MNTIAFAFRRNMHITLRQSALLLLILVLIGCNNDRPNLATKIITKSSDMNDAVLVQMLDIIKNSIDKATNLNLKTYNPYSINHYCSQNKNTIFTSDMKFTEAGIVLKKMIDKDCRNFGLFPNAYHKKAIDSLYQKLTADGNAKQNAEDWAKAEILMTDAFFQIAKHIKNGRLYTDTNYKYYDSAITKNVFLPLLQAYTKAPNTLPNLLHQYEPNLHDYDSLKIHLQSVVMQMDKGAKQYTNLVYPYKDSVQFVKNVVLRIQEEGLALSANGTIDSLGLIAIIKEYQTAHGQVPTGKYSKEMIVNMNTNNSTKFMKIALALDKFKNLKIPNTGDYVIVNIPAFSLRGYTANKAAVESKVAVGKIATKTPIMESEISDIIVMPKWFVPPSILKIPGYIERHRRNKNYIVTGNRVVQKSGPGNALGEMKFNFKSGEAIYLHDTNEKWAFSSNYRAVSHGCVRVQDYKNLASFISSVSPIIEKNYKKVVNTFSVDTATNDTTFKYKYVVKDSIIYKDDVIPNMAKNKAHHELSVGKKVPIYIKYYTCAIRNGVFVMYNDVYGYDKVLQEKYFSKYL
jgi:L,D-transpeptidase YcbB